MSDLKFNEIEIVDINLLKTHPDNYRFHKDDQLAHIMASIQANGIYKNIVVANDNTILAGHGVVEASKKLHISQVPIFRLNIGPNDMLAKKILTGDNEISKLGEVDDRKLSEILKDILVDSDLLGTGFDEKQLANLIFVTRPEGEIRDLNAAAEWVGLPEYDLESDALGSEYTLLIIFKSKEEMEQFTIDKEIQIRKKFEKKWSATWPHEEFNDIKALKFEEDTNEQTV